MNNQSIADVLTDIADLLDLKKVKFKPQAFRRAAQTVRNLSESLKEIDAKGGLEELPTIGKGIASIIHDLLITGHTKELEELTKSLPPGLLDLFDIPGLGPKSIARLYHELGIQSIAELETAVRTHRVAGLKGFGHKTEYEILEGIAIVRAGQERMGLGSSYQLAQSIAQKLSFLPGVSRVEIVGSIARMRETTKDIDILCAAKDSSGIMKTFTTLPQVTKVIAKGKTKSSILYGRMHVDVRVVHEHQFGAAKQYFTGSKQHNVKLRQRAIARGMKLSEYGLFDRKSEAVIESKSEERIYKHLDLQWVPPEMREDSGEIELAEKHALPTLVTGEDICGDFHMHTTHSDGQNTIQEMVDAASQLKYSYIAITDHSKTTAIARGNDDKQMRREMKEIHSIDAKSKLRVFAGSETDILADGSLDYTTTTLNALDVVIASVHSGFKKDNTARVVSALDNRYVHCLGHMTGRLINHRPPFPLDIGKVLQAAKDNDIAIEVNAQPARLDASSAIVRQAVEIGCKFMINSDAHSVAGLGALHFGVGTARRGWAEATSVVNTWPLKKVEKFLER